MNKPKQDDPAEKLIDYWLDELSMDPVKIKSTLEQRIEFERTWQRAVRGK